MKTKRKIATHTVLTQDRSRLLREDVCEDGASLT